MSRIYNMSMELELERDTANIWSDEMSPTILQRITNEIAWF